MRNGLDLGRGSYRLVWSQAAFGVDEVGSEDGVDQRGFAQTGLTFTTLSVKVCKDNRAE